MWGAFALLGWPLLSLPGFIGIFVVFAAVTAAGTSILALGLIVLGLFLLVFAIGFAMRYEPRLPGTREPPRQDAEAERRRS